MQFWICLFYPSLGLRCDILIVTLGLCEFADISRGFLECVLSARGARAVQILLTVQWRASCGVVEDAFLMWSMLDDGASLGDGWAGAENGICVCTRAYSGQKISIAQQITCCLYICNLWRLFRCCRLGQYLLLLSWLLLVWKSRKWL